MACRACLQAVLTERELEHFCERFALVPSDLEANFEGWRKHILLSKDTVFLFPRTPEFLEEFARELDLYETFARFDSLPLPRLQARVKDPAICYYEFGAVTRLQGTVFSRFIERISYEQFQEFLLKLAELIAEWHAIPREELPRSVPGAGGAVHGETTVDNWTGKVLHPDTTAEAVDFIYDLLGQMSHPRPLPEALAGATATKQRWVPVLQELAGLPDVLAHCDIHDDNMLVDPATLGITGVFDWGVARRDNPVWDFNFGEWGMGICHWWRDLPALRRQMWERYLEARGLRLPTAEGINLYYTLWDLIWLVLKRKDRPSIVATGTDYETAVRMYLERLEAVTGRL